ncbi:MAG: hypothetical protein M3Z20_00885 [Chloroflexota bacterium]|nr:hypothetical protein [Chloroflexota bacterium]
MTNDTPSRGRATTQQLDELHGMLAEVFSAELQQARDGPDCPECGRKARIEPAMLGQIVKWLSANGIDVPARAAGVDRMLGGLPDMDALEAGLVVSITRARKE